FVKDLDERLTEHGGGEGVGQDHVAAGGVGEGLHFKKTDLVETSGKDVNDVAVVSGPLRHVVVVLDGLLIVLDVVPLNIVVRPNGLSEFRANHHTRTLRGRTGREQHDASTGVRERRLQKTNRHTKRHTG